MVGISGYTHHTFFVIFLRGDFFFLGDFFWWKGGGYDGGISGYLWVTSAVPPSPFFFIGVDGFGGMEVGMVGISGYLWNYLFWL